MKIIPHASFKGGLCIGLFLLIAFFCFSCSSDKENSEKKVFNLNLDQGVTSLDPAFARNNNNIWCDHMLFNGLLQLSDSLKAVPSIAKSFELSNDGLSYTFHLRHDVFFHDDEHFAGGNGRKVVAADFVYSFNRIIDPKVASSGSWIFNDRISDKTPFEALNDSTFRINLKKPFPAFPSLLTGQYCVVVPHEVAEFYGKDFRNHPVGTGPFKFKHWKEGEIMVFLKNEKYFEKEGNDRLPYLDAVKITFIADKQTAFMEFIKHNLDFFNNIDGSYRDDILTKSGKLQEKYRGKFVLLKGPYLNTEYIGMLVDSNMAIVKNSPFKDKRFRQAINYAIDRNQLVKYLRNSVGTPAYQGFIPKGMPGFDEKKVVGYTFKPEKSKQLLAQMGYPNGKGLPEITLHTTTTYRDLIEFVQGQLSDVGIKTKVEVQPGASLREMISKNGVNFFRGSWSADFPDAENYLSVFYSKNYVPIGPNYTSFKSKRFDELFEKSYYETNDSARYQLYHQMDNLVMEEAPVLVLFYDQLVNMYQNNITGYHTNALNLLNLKRVKKN
ncbi:ABC transporter substrate-binding protein [Solitalea sp. MAHUQ-68]|uniref:ABC transporter substrate-binding protein n=1 Tax=Solitalea agri TaxID=2953739 RepID=A0A9X2JC15_9SPHI|nr:ABC transporter substrate-binding protein [Solitalea agri]MCO4292583.1 ABC transporter substrate-binding protein [Solitalea agri]